MSFWDNLQRHGNSKWKKTPGGMLNLDERTNIKVEASNAPRLNMNHGFIKSIVRNQIDRFIFYTCYICWLPADIVSRQNYWEEAARRTFVTVRSPNLWPDIVFESCGLYQAVWEIRFRISSNNLFEFLEFSRHYSYILIFSSSYIYLLIYFIADGLFPFL